MDERLVRGRDEPGRDLKNENPRLSTGVQFGSGAGDGPSGGYELGACDRPSSTLGGLRKGSQSRGGVISISTGRHSPVRSFSSGTIAPLRRTARRRVRMRSSRSSRVARAASPSASVLAVLPGLDGFLRDRSFRIVRRAAGLLRPAAGHGVRQVSGSGDNSAQVVVAGSLPTGAYPSKRSPPRCGTRSSPPSLLARDGRSPIGAITGESVPLLATFPSEGSRCFPGIAERDPVSHLLARFRWLSSSRPHSVHVKERCPWTCPFR